VAIVTAQFGRRAGVIAGIASALAFNFFFVPPVLEFTFPPVAQEYMLWMCLAGCLFIRRVSDQ
jgi:K+-sensing histidine kinase KdpD